MIHGGINYPTPINYPTDISECKRQQTFVTLEGTPCKFHVTKCHVQVELSDISALGASPPIAQPHPVRVNFHQALYFDSFVFKFLAIFLSPGIWPGKGGWPRDWQSPPARIELANKKQKEKQ